MVIETDYLVVGAGASGMAFVDSLIAESDADVVMVDRRHRPGGHWNDAYPFVRLHQPSAYYGVNSRVLGSDAIDQAGPNAGFYERATAAEICDYYNRVLDEQLVASGRVRFFGMSDYIGDRAGKHCFVSRLTGEETRVRVRRKFVDATYLEAAVPATHPPPFDVDDDARLVPVGELTRLTSPGTGYTVIGGGKTAMDACQWLLDNDVPPETIRWIRPRETWLLDREFQQPLELLPALIEGVSLTREAAAEAESIPDLFDRLEACGQLMRLDPGVDATMYRCATVSRDEVESLRRIDNVVRRGRVAHIGAHRITLDDGSIPTDPAHVHIDCTAAGLGVPPVRPIFESDRVTLQLVRSCQPAFSAALVAFVEASSRSDQEKNRLCPTNQYPNAAVDWIPTHLISQLAQTAWSDAPDVKNWVTNSRLNLARGIGEHRDDPRMQSALDRMSEKTGPAIANLQRLLDQAGSPASDALRPGRISPGGGV